MEGVSKATNSGGARQTGYGGGSIVSPASTLRARRNFIVFTRSGAPTAFAWSWSRAEVGC